MKLWNIYGNIIGWAVKNLFLITMVGRVEKVWIDEKKLYTISRNIKTKLITYNIPSKLNFLYTIIDNYVQSFKLISTEICNVGIFILVQQCSKYIHV